MAKEKAKKEELSAEQIKMKDTVDKINAVLKDAGMVLQPFLDFQEFGVIPRVRVNFPPKQEDIAKTV